MEHTHADDLPLKGLRVLITRARAQARELCVAFERQGAYAIVVPALEFAPPTDTQPLDAALSRLNDYGWVVFTSANGVDFTVKRLGDLGIGGGVLKQVRVAAIGTATVEALEKHEIPVALMPPIFTNEAFAQALVENLRPGERVLLPRPEVADDTIPNLLAAAGVHVESVIAYRSFPPKNLPTHAREAFNGGVDIVTFTSPSTVTNLASALGEDRGKLERAVIACIGPATARAARAAGLTVHAEAKEQSAKGLADALREWRLGAHK